MKKRSVLPGFGLTLGYTLFYLGLIVLIPLSALFVNSAGLGIGEFWKTATSGTALAAYRLTFGTALLAALVNSFFGLIAAWTLVRYRFPLRKLVDAAIDLPFALPTAVSGIALALVYSRNGWLGRPLGWIGIQATGNWIGITIAMTFIGLPFVIRTLEPAIEDLERESEEAAASLGASRFATIRRIIFPALIPSILTGFSLSYARALGEYGSIVAISGNVPGQTQIVSQLIVEKVDNSYTADATAIALVMLASSFLILIMINSIQWWVGARYRRAV